MKKRSTATILSAALVLGLLPMSACGEGNDAKSIMQGAADKLKEVTSVSQTMDMNMALSMDMSAYGYDSNDISYKMSLTTDTTSDPYASHSQGTLDYNMFGNENSQEMEIYTCDEDGSIAAYSSSGDGWTKTVAGSSGNDMISGELYEKVGDGTLEASLKEDGTAINDQETYEVSFQINGDLLEEYIGDSMTSSSGLDTSSVDWENTTADVVVNIYKESGLPAKMELNCLPLGEAMMSSVASSLETEIEMSDFTVTTTFDAYDSVEAIEIPAEVTSEAVVVENTTENTGTATADEAENTDVSGAAEDTDTGALEPNKDGSYTLTDYEGTRTADVVILPGSEYNYSSTDTLETLSQDKQFSMSYQLNSYLTADEAEDYVTDTSWYGDDSDYKDVKLGDTKTMKVNGMEISYCTLDYTYDADDTTYDIRSIYGWTAYDKEATFLVYIYEYLEDGMESEISTDLLKEAFENVTLNK